MPIVLDYVNELILITSPDTDVDGQTVHDFVQDQAAAPVGSLHPWIDQADPQNDTEILYPDGKIEDPSNPGVFSQIILRLNDRWQMQFWGGSGYTRIFGAKFVGGLGGEVMKATGTAGDITVLESPVDGVTVAVPTGTITEQDKIEIVDKTWDRVLTGATHNIPSSSGRRLRQLGDVIPCTVTDASATASSFITDCPDSRDDFYNDQLIRFTSGNLSGHVRIILDYDGSNGRITVSEDMVEAPDNGSEFDIIPDHIHPIPQIGIGVWDTIIGTHPAGSFGEWVSKKLLTLAKFIGLK